MQHSNREELMAKYIQTELASGEFADTPCAAADAEPLDTGAIGG